jgi:hypothetical protein
VADGRVTIYDRDGVAITSVAEDRLVSQPNVAVAEWRQWATSQRDRLKAATAKLKQSEWERRFQVAIAGCHGRVAASASSSIKDRVFNSDETWDSACRRMAEHSTHTHQSRMGSNSWYRWANNRMTASRRRVKEKIANGRYDNRINAAACTTGV